MNDLEICKRIADIEGVDWFESEGIISHQNNLGLCREYSPLTDDGLCFRLMIKYNCKLSKYSDGFSAYSQWEHLNSGRELTESPNKAICLAIIAAHKDV